MKKIQAIAILLLFIFSSSCEDVVEVELQKNEPRLVVEASLLWEKETAGNEQYIRLTTTAPFFDDEIPPATGATVKIIDEDGREFNFEEAAPGIYKNENFNTAFGVTYELEIQYKGEIYSASERFVPTPPIDYIEQSKTGGFGGDEIELRAFFRDPPDIKNYYLFRFLHQRLSLQIYDDEFTDGNLNFAYFTDEELVPADEVGFEIQGISQRFYDYMFILRSQSGSNGGGPFQTQPTTVRGNIINITNPKNFPFGFFRLSETDSLVYRVE